MVSGNDMITISFGGVTVQASANSASAIERNIEDGRRGLERAAKRFERPGLEIDVGPDIPLFVADPDDPAIVIRDLHGEKTKGTFRGGLFEAIE